MSADTPRDPSAAQPHHAEHGRRPEPDNGPRAEKAPPEQRAEADRSKQPEHATLGRASITRPGAPRRRCRDPAMPSGPMTASTGDRPRQPPAAPGTVQTTTPGRPSSGTKPAPVAATARRQRLLAVPSSQARETAHRAALSAAQTAG